MAAFDDNRAGWPAGPISGAGVSPPKFARVVVSIPSPGEGRPLRCSPWAQGVEVDPVGTAGTYAGFCAVEWPLPWLRDMAELPELAPLASVLRERGMRLQALVPARLGGSKRRVICYLRGPGEGFAGYRRTEALARPGDVLTVAADLLDGRDAGGAIDDPVTADVMVCCHGRRDVCCGALGTVVAQELERGLLGPGVRCWRTSHTRGHRFAPTAFVFPEGTAWAYVEAAMLRRIVHREGALDEMLPRYRGCAGLSSPAVQALERVALAEVGWDLFDHARHGEELGGGRVRLSARSDDGTARVWQGTAVTTRWLPVPECGRPIHEAKSSQPQLAVIDVSRIS